MFGKLPLFRTGALPHDPTPALPGTEEKVRVMIERAARREQLFHPLDGKMAATATPKPAAPVVELPATLSLPAALASAAEAGVAGAGAPTFSAEPLESAC